MPDFTGQRDQGIRPFQSGQQRVYIQIDPMPTQPILDYGLTELGQITFSTPDPEQILVPSRTQFNQWTRVGRVYQPEEFQSVDFTTTANGAGKEDWEDLRRLQIEFVIYNTVGAAQEGTSLQADDAHSWTEKGVLPDCAVVSISPFGDAVNSKSENAESLATGSIQHGNGTIARTVGIAPIGGSAPDRDVLDGAALSQGIYSELFAITTKLSTTNPSAVVYGRTDLPSAFTQTDITSFSTNGLASRCYIAGNSLLVLQGESATPQHHFSSLDDIRAANDAFSTVTGYTALKAPVAAAVISEGNIIIVGLAGYIYRLTNITSVPTVIDAGVLTTQDLNDVDHFNNQVVAVGGSNALLVSNDGGITGWSSVTGPSVGNSLLTVQVVKENQWYIGTDAGEIFFVVYDPINATITSTELTVMGGVPTSVDRVNFFDDSRIFGWVVTNSGLLYRTSSAGVRVSSKSPEFARLSTLALTSLFAAVPVDENEVFLLGDTGIIGLGQ